MAQLAIRGHATRGKEVIEILEMLGGKNHSVFGSNDDLYYYIATDDYIYASDIEYKDFAWKYTIFTLDEFLEKFPYKVGDKVKDAIIEDYVGIITEAQWDNYKKEVVYTVIWDNMKELCYFAKDLQPYKEETMENKLEQITLDIPDGYEFFGIDDDNKIVLTKKETKYPKTYEECCRIVNANPCIRLVYDLSDGQKYSYDVDNLKHYEHIRELLICRDAYWKIAGDWKPEWFVENKYTIHTSRDKIVQSTICNANTILVFPTKEIRDAFYENFKELIETCKELL